MGIANVENILFEIGEFAIRNVCQFMKLFVMFFHMQIFKSSIILFELLVNSGRRYGGNNFDKIGNFSLFQSRIPNILVPIFPQVFPIFDF